MARTYPVSPHRAGLCASLTLLLICPPCFGQDLEVFTGYQFDDRGEYFAYFGSRVSTTPTDWPVEPVLQLFAFRQRYFFTSQGHVLEAHLNQLTPSVGIAKKIGDLTLSALAGPTLQETRAATVDGMERNTSDLGYTVQAEASYYTERDGFEGIVTYSNLKDFFFGRVRWKHDTFQIPAGHSIKSGLELQSLGNSQFQAVLFGGLLETAVGKLVLLIKGGYQYNTTFRSGEYGGIELYAPF